MSTEVRVYNFTTRKWNEYKIEPGKSSTVIHDFHEGGRDDYVISCSEDDSHTRIDWAENAGVVGKKPEFKPLKELGDGEVFKKEFKTLAQQKARRFEITHRSGK